VSLGGGQRIVKEKVLKGNRKYSNYPGKRVAGACGIQRVQRTKDITVRRGKGGKEKKEKIQNRLEVNTDRKKQNHGDCRKKKKFGGMHKVLLEGI